MTLDYSGGETGVARVMAYSQALYVTPVLPGVMCLNLSLGALSFSGCPRSLVRLPAHFLAGGRRARGEDRESKEP